ncbi:hypothetical protein F4X86_00490 [Candidatus Saccharibacteria bacterium]|nr:hypothetical protein [Candidatus Saccharibacteria bacterium]
MNRSYYQPPHHIKNRAVAGRSAIIVHQLAIGALFAVISFLAAVGLAAIFNEPPANYSGIKVGGETAGETEPVAMPEELPPAPPTDVNDNPPEEPPVEIPEPQPEPEPEPVVTVDDRYDHIPQNVKDLANRLELSDAGKEMLYDNNPRIFDDDSDPGYGCRSSSADVVVYGCWQTGSIAILRTPSLETTAAHELLHAAYYDLYIHHQSDEIDRLLDNFKRDNPEVVAEFLEIYEGHYQYEDEEARQWAERSEIHSFVGSQIAEIPQALEEHYSRYFNNRRRVVDFYETWLDSFERKREESHNVNQLAQDQHSEYQECIFDFEPPANCQQFEADTDAYQAYADCLTSHLTSFDDCQRLKPAFIPYEPGGG